MGASPGARTFAWHNDGSACICATKGVMVRAVELQKSLRKQENTAIKKAQKWAIKTSAHTAGREARTRPQQSFQKGIGCAENGSIPSRRERRCRESAAVYHGGKALLQQRAPPGDVLETSTPFKGCKANTGVNHALPRGKKTGRMHGRTTRSKAPASAGGCERRG